MIWKRTVKPVCLHNWKITGAQYHPAPSGVKARGFIDPETMDHMLYGTTILSYRCENCNLAMTDRVTGKYKGPEIRWPDVQS